MDGQSLIYGSRALSFVGGPSLGGVLVQVLTAPFAIVADAAGAMLLLATPVPRFRMPAAG